MSKKFPGGLWVKGDVFFDNAFGRKLSRYIVTICHVIKNDVGIENEL